MLDNAPSHPSAEKLNIVDPYFNVMFLPSNSTGIIQPTNQGVIEKLKRIYRKHILRHLLSAENEENTMSF